MAAAQRVEAVFVQSGVRYVDGSDGVVTRPVAALSVASRRFLNGCSSGLGERTALVEVAVRGELSRFDLAATERIRAGVRSLCPQDPLPLVRQADWPNVFVGSEPDAGEDPMEWLGRWMIALTVAIQRWGRDPVWRGRVVEAESGRLLLAIPWRRQKFFDDAVNLTLKLLSTWIWQGAERPAAPIVNDHFGDRWLSIQNAGLNPITLRFIQAAVARGFPVDVLPSAVQIGWGANAQLFDRSLIGTSSWIACALSRNRWKTSQMLRRHAVPVPNGRLVVDIAQAQRAAADLGWPVVLKPTISDGSGGVTAGIADLETLNRVFEEGAKTRRNAVLESHISGEYYRLIVMHGVLLSAVRRRTSGVVDVTDAVHPDNVALARRVARLIGLDVAGVDVIAPDIGQSWVRGGLAVCEVNAQPELSEHWRANRERDVAGEILDGLFVVAGRSARIPTAAVTGGDHAGRSAELLQRIWTSSGTPAGVCTTELLRIGPDLYSDQDPAARAGVRAILIDPGMQAAAFELPARQLAATGHPCDWYGVAGLLGVHSGGPEAEMVERAREAVVFNADDPACLAVRSRARTSRHILVSSHRGNAALADHLRAGGEAVSVDDGGRMVVAVGSAETHLLQWSGDPAALFAAALAWAHGIDAESISRALSQGTP